MKQCFLATLVTTLITPLSANAELIALLDVGDYVWGTAPDDIAFAAWQGEMIYYADGSDPDTARKIGPGAYCSISRGLALVSACVLDEPCVAYLYQGGAFDFLPVEQ